MGASIFKNGTKVLIRELKEVIRQGFSKTQIKQMRQFYLVYGKGQPQADLFEPQLSCTHYCVLKKVQHKLSAPTQEDQDVYN